MPGNINPCCKPVVDPCCFPSYGFGNNRWYAFILVLFILLVIVGCAFWY